MSMSQATQLIDNGCADMGSSEIDRDDMLLTHER